jgi:hypothetical protein
MDREHPSATTSQDVTEEKQTTPSVTSSDVYWWDKLRTAETEADFDSFKDEIDFTMHSIIFQLITSPEVLRVCLRHAQLEKKSLLEASYRVTSSYRIDLLAIFLEHLTWEEFMRDDSFIQYINNVLVEGHVDVMNFLLDKGLSVDYKIQYGYGYHSCLLAFACTYGKVDIIDLLLSRGADANKEITGGVTAAFRAMLCGDPTVLDRLFLHGADLFHRDDKGRNLWTSMSPFPWRDPQKVTMMLHLTKYRVPLDRETYDKCLAAYSYDDSLKIKELLEAMRELLLSQGEEVEPLFF